MMSSQLRQVYEFGPFRLDAAERRLLRDEEPVPLTPKAFDMLLVLVRRSGHLVCKDELMREVWPNCSVEEGNLSHNVYLLRKALGRDAAGNLYIETISKHGYRLVAHVAEPLVTRAMLAEPTNEHPLAALEGEELEEERAVGPQAQPQSKAASEALCSPPAPRPRLLSVRRLLVLACALLSCAALVSFRSMEKRKAARAMRTRSIAVLPFKPIEVKAGDDLLGLAVTDATIKKLSRLRGFAVRATSAVSRYTDRRDDSLTVGRKLGVDAVLEGVVQRSGDDVRVTVQLIDVGGGQSLWAQKFDARCTDMLALQDTISEQLAEALKQQLTSQNQDEVARREAEATEAYRSTITISP
jgi:TolB-like protein/DNA-binding winged helix-turn-helix (wHTH) protein